MVSHSILSVVFANPSRNRHVVLNLACVMSMGGTIRNAPQALIGTTYSCWPHAPSPVLLETMFAKGSHTYPRLSVPPPQSKACIPRLDSAALAPLNDPQAAPTCRAMTGYSRTCERRDSQNFVVHGCYPYQPSHDAPCKICDGSEGDGAM